MLCEMDLCRPVRKFDTRTEHKHDKKYANLQQKFHLMIGISRHVKMPSINVRGSVPCNAILPERTPLPDRMADIFQWHFEIQFLKWKLLYFDLNFT